MGRQAAGGVLVQATGGHPAGGGGVQATVGGVLADNHDIMAWGLKYYKRDRFINIDLLGDCPTTNYTALVKAVRPKRS